MAMERTLAIIKPDAVADGHVGAILTRIEEAGFRITAMKLTRLTRRQAEGFYHVHRGKPFFDSLVTFMTSGPVVLLELEGEDAIARWRAMMGPTNAAEAPAGTLRAAFGSNIERNAVHGSDAPETAEFERAFFFGVFDRPYDSF